MAVLTDRDMFGWPDLLWERIAGARGEDISLLHDTRRRLLTFTATLTIVIATLWVTLTGGSVMGERPFLALLCGLTPLVFAIFPFLTLRSKISLDILSHAYLVTLYLIVTATAAALGGAVSSTSFFLMLLPLLATLLLGIRVGVIWVAVVTATYAGLHLARGVLPPAAYETVGAAPFDFMRMQEVSFWNAAMMTLLALAAALSVANFRAVVGKSSELLNEATQKTRDAREAQIAAEQLARSKSEFMANVSHELRTPLNAVIGYSEMLIETAEERGDGEAVSDNRKVLDAALKLRSMINDLLKLAAIDAGKLRVDIEECRTGELTLAALEFVDPFVQAKGAQVCVDDGTEPGVWHMDGDKVGACLRHLLAHAAHCCGGRLDVRLSQRRDGDASFLAIAVEDDGARVEPAHLDLLFEPFAQPEISGGRYYEGMPLSLALAQRIARLLGGELSAASGADGAGACFRMEIPALFVPDAQQTRAA